MSEHVSGKGRRKIWLIIQREYLTRIRSKWFIISTVLGPLILVGFVALPVAISYYAAEAETERMMLAVVDSTGVLFPELQQAVEDEFVLVPALEPEDSLREAVRRGEIDGYLVLPKQIITSDEAQAVLYLVGGGGLSRFERLQTAIDRLVKAHRLKQMEVPPEVLQMVQKRIRLRTIRLDKEGEEVGSSLAYIGVGYVMGFLIYFLVLMYGGLVMRGVIEEKVNRVVEIIISSVRPFQLMMGKVIGIGAVGLTQAVAWVALSLLGLTVAGFFIAKNLNPADFQLPDSASQQALMDAAGIHIPEIPASLIVYFFLFFIGGYLLYASLFAAIAAGADQESDVQSMQFPVTFLVVIPFVTIPVILEQPDATISVVLSMIPFFSPILMTVRLAITEVPIWQSVGALILLALSFVVMIYVAGRIYRVGILMYGRRPTFKDLIRWARMG